MIVVLPLVLFALRQRLTWVVAGGLAAGCAAQVVATVVSPRGWLPGVAPGVVDIARSYAANALVPVWWAPGGIEQVAPSTARYLTLATVLAVVAATVVSLAWGSRTVQVAAVALPVMSVVVFAMATEANHNLTLLPDGSRRGYVLLRYGALPSMCLLASLTLAVVVICRARGGARSCPWC